MVYMWFELSGPQDTSPLTNHIKNVFINHLSVPSPTSKLKTLVPHLSLQSNIHTENPGSTHTSLCVPGCLS